MAQLSIYVGNDGIAQEWLNQGIGAHWQSVDGDTPETNEYMYSESSAEDEEFIHEACGLDPGTTINFIQVRIYGKGTAAGDTLNIGYRVFTGDRVASETDTTLTTSWAYYTSDQFTARDSVAKVDGTNSSLQSINVSRNKEVQVAWVEIIVDYELAAQPRSQVIFIN